MNASESPEWNVPERLMPPGQMEIHIWRIKLDLPPEEVARLEKQLSTEECERCRRFRFATDQRRFIIRRAALRRLLAAGLKIVPEAVQFKPGAHGKPVVCEETDACDLQFNCSHSGDWALIAIARGIELGVDLEQHKDLPDAGDLATRFFSASEIRELAGLPPSQKTVGFFNCWTRKEAFVKAIGLGLSFPLGCFSVSLATDKPATIVSVPAECGAINQWSMTHLGVCPDYSAAIVFAGENPRMKFFEWSPLVCA